MYNPLLIKIAQNEYLNKDYYIGKGAVINASIGTSNNGDDFQIELQKAQIAMEAGASIITDHSICGNVNDFHKRLRQQVPVPLGAVPVYELSMRNAAFSDQEALDIVEEYLLRGFNILSLHCSVIKEDAISGIADDRIIPITSKGGRVMLERIALTKTENPFYSRFDRLLDIFKKHNGVISLAPTWRPGSVADISLNEGDPYWIEIKRMSSLVKQAIMKEVPIIVEGIGHSRIDLIPAIVKKSKELCFQVPYRVLTVATDVALGYDNISSAIASSVAVLNGANIVTAVSPSEHIGLPTIADVEMGVVSANIAIHSAEICLSDSIAQDVNMSKERTRGKSCQGSVDCAIYPNGAEIALKNKKANTGCSMCGDLCVFKDKQ